MSLPPITIPDLDPAGPIDRVNDLLVIRQGLNDKKATVSQISDLDISSFPDLPAGGLLATDKIIVGRNNGLGGYTNYIADPRNLGFLPGVTMWFYADTAPLFWRIRTSLTDRVLAVKGGTQAYTNWGQRGTWDQENHTLTVNEIPAHSHRMATYKTVSSGNGVANKISASTSNTSFTATTDNTGGGQGHNHGNTWRPRAAVGICCEHIGTPT